MFRIGPDSWCNKLNLVDTSWEAIFLLKKVEKTFNNNVFLSKKGIVFSPFLFTIT